MPTDRLSVTFQALADPTAGPSWARWRSAKLGDRARGTLRDEPPRRLQASQGAGARPASSRAAARRNGRPCRIEPQALKDRRRLARTRSPVWDEASIAWKAISRHAGGREDRETGKKETKRGRKNNARLALTLPSDREIVVTRVFDVPAGSFSRRGPGPSHVAHGTAVGLTLTVCEIVCVLAAPTRFVLRAPAVDHTMKAVYPRDRPPGRLVYTEGYVTEGSPATRRS